jgi:hypothetical protein
MHPASSRAKTTTQTHLHHVAFSENEPLPYADADTHHHISDSRKHYQDAFSFAQKNPEDPATKVSTNLFLFQSLQLKAIRMSYRISCRN